MKVWVIEENDYDCYGNLGIFDSAEAAKESMPGSTWEQEEDGSWHSTMKFSRFWIYEEEVQTVESVRADSEDKIVANDREKLREEVRVPLPYEVSWR